LPPDWELPEQLGTKIFRSLLHSRQFLMFDVKESSRACKNME